MIQLLVVRHAQSRWNAEGRWQGRADPPLSPAGEEQARMAGIRLAEALSGHATHGIAPDLRAPGTTLGPFTSLWSSDLERARETAALIGEALGWPDPPRQVEDLREHDVGDWSGLTHAEIEQRWPGLIEAWGSGRLAATPGGEARAVFDRRVEAGIRTVAAEAPDGLAVVVSHGGVLRAVNRWLGGTKGPIRHLEGLLLDADRSPQPRIVAPVALLGAATPDGHGPPAGARAGSAAEEGAGQTE